MRTPFVLSARLVLSLEDNDFLVHATDEQIVVDLPSWRAGLTVLRLQRLRGGWGQFLAQAQRWMPVAEFAVQFRLAGNVVARLGPDTRPGIVSWLFDLGPLEVRPLQLLRSLWSRPRTISSQE
jgi:hypothetical protein